MQIQTILFLVCSVLSVKGTPFFSSALFDPAKSIEEHESSEESEQKNITLQAIESNETHEVLQPKEGDHSNAFEATLILGHIPPKHGHGHGHGHGHDNKLMGPIELGLRNVVASSALAAEELYSEMKELSNENSQMMNNKFQILTASAMAELLTPLTKIESDLKKNQSCGDHFVSPLKAILGEIQSGLIQCATNLTYIIETYKTESTDILSSISTAADDTNKLSESCELGENFAVGTFCVVNNLAEVNTRVVLDVNNMKKITSFVKENIENEFSTAASCYSKLVETESLKLSKLHSDFVEKCATFMPQNL